MAVAVIVPTLYSLTLPPRNRNWGQGARPGGFRQAGGEFHSPKGGRVRWPVLWRWLVAEKLVGPCIVCGDNGGRILGWEVSDCGLRLGKTGAGISVVSSILARKNPQHRALPSWEGEVGGEFSAGGLCQAANLHDDPAGFADLFLMGRL